MTKKNNPKNILFEVVVNDSQVRELMPTKKLSEVIRENIGNNRTEEQKRFDANFSLPNSKGWIRYRQTTTAFEKKYNGLKPTVIPAHLEIGNIEIYVNKFSREGEEYTFQMWNHLVDALDLTNTHGVCDIVAIRGPGLLKKKIDQIYAQGVTSQEFIPKEKFDTEWKFTGAVRAQEYNTEKVSRYLGMKLAFVDKQDGGPIYSVRIEDLVKRRV